jgi:BioD-like phosphotransacetylase family protein
MRPLYVSATKQDTGKTTLVIGLMQTLRDLGHDLGYMKPIGQRYVRYRGMNIDEDAVLARHAFDLKDHPADMSPITIERGFTEQYIFHRDPQPLEWRIMEAFDRLRKAHDLLAIEGTGHAGVGSCFDLSNARVAELLGAGVIIVTEGGIGRAIDEVALSLHLFRKHNVPVLGVILNKVWPEKLTKVHLAVTEGLAHLGTRLLGAVPYRSQLVYPRMEQIAAELRGQILCGEEGVGNVVEHTVVAAMSPQNVCAYLRPNSLVITPGDRLDNILISAITCPMLPGASGPIAGLVLTGGFEPPASVRSLLAACGIPVVLCKEDTYTVAVCVQDLRFKIRPQDTDKIEAAKILVHESIDIPSLLNTLAEFP